MKKSKTHMAKKIKRLQIKKNKYPIKISDYQPNKKYENDNTPSDMTKN